MKLFYKGGNELHQLVPVFFLACVGANVPPKERSIPVADFDRVRVQGNLKVEIETGKPSSARATGDTVALDAVNIFVDGRTLVLRKQNSLSWGQQPSAPVVFKIATRSLNQLVSYGDSEISLASITTTNFRLSAQGGGSINISKADISNLSADLIGSANVAISGKAKSVMIVGEGNVQFTSPELRAEKAEIRWNSLNPLTLWVSKFAQITTAGLSQIDITGPTKCAVKSWGKIPVKCGKPKY